jgi:hypothetical protein
VVAISREKGHLYDHPRGPGPLLLSTIQLHRPFPDTTFCRSRFALAVRWPSSSVFARRLLVSNSVFARRSLVSGISFLCPLQPVPCNLIFNPRCIDAFFWPFHFSFLF